MLENASPALSNCSFQRRRPYFCPMKKFLRGILPAALLLTVGCNNADESGNEDNNMKTTPLISYSVVQAHPHDTSSFTEGLEFYQNTLLESTGEYGKSKLLQYDLQTGRVMQEISLEPKFFGEGISVINDTVYQMTYKEEKVFVYDVKTFKKLAELPMKGEGWGMTNDGKQLIVSNGSNNLYFYEPGTFRLLRVQAVTENGTPAVNINELEYVNGFVYANQWQYPYILKIDPATGEVVAKMDFSDLVTQVKSREPESMEFNGIAYNPETKKFYVTGKNWSQIYEIGFEF